MQLSLFDEHGKRRPVCLVVLHFVATTRLSSILPILWRGSAPTTTSSPLRQPCILCPMARRTCILACAALLSTLFLTFRLLRDATASFDQSHHPYGDFRTSPTHQAPLPVPAPSPKSEWCQYNDCLKGKWVPRNLSFKNLAEFQEAYKNNQEPIWSRAPSLLPPYPAWSSQTRRGPSWRHRGSLISWGAHRGYGQDENLGSGGVCCPDVEDSGRVDHDWWSVRFFFLVFSDESVDNGE
jgi:hypothetical protein